MFELYQNNTKEESFFWVLAAVRENFSWLSAIAAVLAPLAGVLSLFFFARYIGRPDIFIRSLEFGPSLIVLLLFCFFTFIAIIGSMLITSFFFMLTLSWLRPKLEFFEVITIHLAAISASGMLGLVAVVMAISYFGRDQAGIWWLWVMSVPPAVFAWPFIRVNINRAERLESPITWRRGISLCTSLIFLVTLTAGMGIFPACYVASLYQESAELPEAAELLKFSLTCLMAMVTSLAPAVGFCLMAREGRRAQLKGALLGLLLFLMLIIGVVPALFSMASESVVRLVGVSDREVRRYLVDGDRYPSDSFDHGRWKINIYEGDKYSLEAFSIYSYGSINLLCPPDLSTIKSKEINRHARACIAFNHEAVDSLGAGSKRPSGKGR